jgi:uncharacterized membrane protein
MPDTAAFCPGCGAAMRPVERVQGKVGILPQVVAGALAYCTFIPAIVFLLVAPFNRNRFVRFHSFQSIGLWLALSVAGAALRLGGFLLFLIPVVGQLLLLLVSMLLGLGFFVIWLVLVVKALQGERFTLPVIGGFAELQADAN